MKFLQAISLCSALIIHAGACSPAAPASTVDGGTDGGGDPPLPPGTPVTGTEITNTIRDTGSTMVPDDLTLNTIAALVPRPSGRFTTIAGLGNADGTFTIPNVPEGTYYLQYGFPGFTYNYIVTSSHRLDFGTDSVGRSDVSYGASTTTLSLALSGLSPWGTKDHVEMLSSNSGAYCYSLNDQTSPPAAGATTLTATKLNYPGYCYPGQLIDGTKSDLAYVYQLSTKTSPVLGAYTALTNSLLLPTNFSVVNAQDNPVTATLAAVPQNSFSTRFAISQFEQLAAAGTPGAQVSGTYLLLESQPGGLAYGPFSTSADLIEVLSTPGAADKDTGALSYGNPFPTSWGTYANVITGFNVSYTLPNAPSPLTVQGSIIYAADASTLGATGLTPPIGPVRNIKVNGQPATSLLANVTTTPTITFDPPALGTPTSYFITVAGVTVSGGMLGTRVVALFRTQGTSITVPPGPLALGAAYVVSISAQYAPKDSFDAPLRKRFPQASAASISSVLEP